MQLLSVNVAQPRAVEINGRLVPTGIYKEPVANRLWMGSLNLAGDGQADLTVHGGRDMAVYAYPFEHYSHWQKVLGADTFPFGMFGENLTVSGLLEDEVCIGDVFEIGTALLQVTMPRIPCFKLGHKLGRPAIIKDFLHSGRSGFYYRVLREGEVGPGDTIHCVQRDAKAINVRTLLGLQKLGEGDPATLQRALSIESLAPALREDLQKRLPRS